MKLHIDMVFEEGVNLQISMYVCMLSAYIVLLHKCFLWLSHDKNRCCKRSFFIRCMVYLSRYLILCSSHE